MMNNLSSKKQQERQQQIERNKKTPGHTFKVGQIVQRKDDEVPFRIQDIQTFKMCERGDWLSGPYVLPPNAPKWGSAYTEDVELVEIPHLDQED